MNKYYYDLHIHSCLSPCGDNDMTPTNIVGMAQLKELDIIALTDHNSCKNCPAFFKNSEKSGLLSIAGMEINTAEEIHSVCLFKTLDASIAFDEYVYNRIPDFKNSTEIYGNQYVTDENENIENDIQKLLINASDISIMELSSLVKRYDGICFPAHIDKPSYSILSVLGGIPPECDFKTFEVSKVQRIDELINKSLLSKDALTLTNSDAHYLWDINERYNYIELEEKSIDCLFEAIG